MDYSATDFSLFIILNNVINDISFLIEEYGKRKSVLFKSKGIKNKKTSVSSRLSSQKRKSALGILSPEVANKRTKRSRSVNVKSEL